MNEHDKNAKLQPNIELVDIEDLRTAFGGESLNTDADDGLTAAPGDTTMCSGWYSEN